MFVPWTRAERLRSITLPDVGPGSAPARSEYGPYRTLEALGTGGMGVVYRAVHEDNGVEAALKTVRLIDPELVAGLRREVRALCRVEHPGIVRILDVGLTDEPPWYAMELLDGATMRQLFRELDPSDAPAPNEPSVASIEERLDATLPLFAPLCDALAFLHGEGVVHLDLKPDNVFVVDGRPRLMDFGLATRLVAAHGREILDVVEPAVGTLPYMAPEQIQGAPLDARADLYALGCMLYEAICGRPPFVGDNSVAVMVGHLNQAPVPPSERVGDVPPELERLVLTLLEKAPHARPGYAADVASALRDLVGGSPAPGTPTPREYLYRPRLVGRDAPLAALRAEASRAKRGRPRVVIVRGESGIGKTRLALELARRVADSGLNVLTGRCRPVGPGEGRGRTLGPFEEILHVLADRCREGGPAFTERALGSAGPVLSPFAPALRDLPGAEAWPALSPLPARAARTRLVAAMTDALFALADTGGPSLLLLDDVHWADDITLAVLGAAASREAGPLLIVATCRSEERDARLDELLALPDVAVVSLDRLDAEGARALAFGMLGDAELPLVMIDRVSEHAGGNPLFIAEYLRAAVREGVLRRVDGRWCADDPDGERVASLPLPRSIRDLVDRRVERLSPLAREAVEIAAVRGRDVEPPSLAAHLSAPDAELSDALQELVATQMLESLPDGRLKFAHAKLREGVYQRIGPERRAALHVAIAEAMEAGPTRPGHAATLAHHYLAGGAFERALEPLERAGLEALESGSHATAEAFFSRAKDLGTGAVAGVSAVRRARWERGLGDARFALGDLGRAAEHGRAALALLGHALPGSGAGAALAVLRQSVSPLHGRPGPDESASLTEAALAALRVAEAGYFALDPAALIGGSMMATTLAERAGTEASAAKAHAMLGLVIGAMRMGGASERLTARGVELAERGTDGTALAFTLYAKATRDLCYRDFDAARASASRAIDVARALGDEHDAGVAETILGHCEYFTGALDAAAERYARVARAARPCGALQHEAWGLYAEARSHVHLGDCARSVALCREALSKLAGQNDAASELICHGLLAWALLGVGDVDGAAATAAIASEHIARSSATIFANIPGYTATCEVWLALARRGHPTAIDRARAAHRKLASLSLGTPLAETSAALYGGRVALARGEVALARVRLTRCLRLAAAHGMPIDEGMAALALAEAETGEAAVRATARGRAILTSIGATRHLEA